MMTDKKPKRTIALYASPKCCEDEQLRLYKSYFNVAWFARAYAAILSEYESVITTEETLVAISGAKVQEQELYESRWRVPTKYDIPFTSLGWGFDAQVALAAEVASGRVERLLLFQDPLDVLEHLPEMNALIRNCTLANVGLHVNAGATFWAETQWTKLGMTGDGFGPWREKANQAALHKLLNPSNQTIAFISHNTEKPKMSRLIYHYRKQFLRPELKLTGTSGTCKNAQEYLVDKDTPHWEVPDLRSASTSASAGHGPTGGDVVIAHDIVKQWFVDQKGEEEANGDRLPKDRTPPYLFKPSVRAEGLSHTIVFFVDHHHAQPHQADIHVLLRTCLHPSHGVHLILNERTALDWAETLRGGTLDSEASGGGL